MAITSYNIAPYFDDYQIKDSNGETADSKNYLRILFQPGFAVQTRELNQMQSILQAQIDRFGTTFYRDGTNVLDGEAAYKDEVLYLEVTPPSGVTADQLVTSAILQKSLELRPTSAANLYVRILHAEKISSTNVRLFVTPVELYFDSPSVTLNNIIPTSTPVFYYKDTKVTTADGDTLADTVGLGTITATGYSFGANVEEGIYFIKGCFVHTPKLTKYWIKNSKTEIPRGDISLRIDENIITSSSDSTLLDNASGSYNFAAPGADRYQIKLSLIFQERNDPDDVSPIRNITNQTSGISLLGGVESFDVSRLFTISETGVVLRENTNKGELEAKLAQRTFEESGNYVLNPFKVTLRDFLNENKNGGRYTSSTLVAERPFGVATESVARTKAIVELEGSTAYLNGFRYDFPQKSTIPIDRARSTDDETNTGFSQTVGNYVDVLLNNSPHGLLNNSPSSVIDSDYLLSTAKDKAVIRSLSYVSDGDSNDITYRAHLYNDVTIDKLKLAFPGLKHKSTLTSIGVSMPSETSQTESLGLKDTTSNANLYRLPADSVQRLTSVTYHLNQKISGTVSSAADGIGTQKLVITAPTDTVFTETTSADKFNYVIIDKQGAGEERIVNPENYTLHSGATGSIEFRDIPANDSPLGFQADHTYKVLAPVRKTVAAGSSDIKAKTKFSTTTYGTQGRAITNLDAGTNATGTVLTLDHQDILPETIRINPDSSSGADQESFFILEDGLDNPDFYGKVRIQLKEDVVFSASNSPHVQYTYYQHGAGDFFCVNSYGDYTSTTTPDIDYGDIPSYKGEPLTDFLDFRRKINFLPPDANSVSRSTVQPVPNKLGSVSLSYYLSRFDRIVLDAAGKLAVVQGVSAVDPEAPEQPAGSLSLYTYFLPAYTTDIKSVSVNYVDNSRFTMKEIGGLKSRIENLEYYSALSILENNTLNKKILNSDGTERFKNGMLIDTFRRDTFADAVNPQYLASMDKELGVLRPYGIISNYRLFYQFPEETNTDDLSVFAPDYYNSESPNNFTINTTTGRSDPSTGRPQIVIAKNFVNTTDGTYFLYQVNDGTNYPEYRLGSLKSDQTEGAVDTTEISTVKLSEASRRIIREVSTGQTVARWEIQERTADGTYSTLYYSTNLGSGGNMSSFPTGVTSWSAVGGVVQSTADVITIYDDITAQGDGTKNAFQKSTSSATNYNSQVRSGFNNLEQVSLWLGEKLATNLTDLQSDQGFGTEELFSNTNMTKTISVQPFENATYEGKLKLSPSSDEWISTDRKPDIINTDDSAQAVLEFLQNETGLLNGAIGTEWNAWQTVLQSREFSSVETDRRRIFRRRGSSVGGLGRGRNAGQLRFAGIQVTREITDITTTEQTRTGVQRELGFNSIEESQGDRVLNINIVPFIRSRDIGIYASGMKPNTRIYVFFDGIDVSRYCAPTAGFIEYGQHEYVPNSEAVTTLDNAVTLPDSRQTSTQTPFNSTEVNHYNLPMYTTAETGEAFLTFRIPNNRDLQFKTGFKQVKVTSSPLNNDDEADTFAEATYSARGLIQDVASVIKSTRVPEIQTTQLNEARTVITDRSRVDRWTYDPVAQTFSVDEDEYPDGLFVSDVDLYFAEKPEYIADAQVYIVTTDNGLPTTTKVPGSHVTLPYHRVNVPANGRNETNGDNILAASTKFKFEHPVFLESKKEYAMVVFSKSPDYRVWCSELGGANLANAGIPLTTNSAIGVLLKSQNGRTWTPDQMKDLTFKLNKCVFKTSGTFTFHSKASGVYGNDVQGIGAAPVTAGQRGKSFSTFNISDETLILPGTSLNYSINFQKSLNSEFLSRNTYGIPLTVKGKTTYDIRKVVNTVSEGVDNVVITATMSAPDRGDGFSDITPVIDLERMSLIGVENYLDLSTTTDNNIQGYISKRVALSNPAEDVRMFISTNRVHPDANIKVYTKIRSNYAGSSDTPWDSLNWQPMTLSAINGGEITNSNSPALKINDNRNTFTEHEYKFNSSPSYFNEYAIKIGWYGDDAAKIVKVKDLRAIATT